MPVMSVTPCTSDSEGEEDSEDDDKSWATGPCSLGLLLVCTVVFLTQFATDFREATTLQVKKEFFGGYAHAAAICSYFDTANVLVVCLTAPILAGLSDSFGRHKVLLWNVAVVAVPNFCLLLRLPFWSYLATDNLLPGDECVLYAFVADLAHSMSAADRAFCFGILAGAQAAGSFLGYGLHGLLASALTPHAVFSLASAANLGALILVLALPESLPKVHRRPFQWGSVSPLGVVRFLFLYRGPLAVYFVIYSALTFAHGGYDMVVDLYNAAMFDFQGRQYDQYWLFCTACDLLASVVLLRVVSYVCSNQAVLLLGTALSTVGYAVGGTASGAFQAYVAGFLHSCGAIWGPGLMALVTACVPPDQEGAIQGALSSVAALVGFGAPVIAGAIFARTSAVAPALVWGLPLAGALVACCAALLVVRGEPKPPPALPASPSSASFASLRGDHPQPEPTCLARCQLQSCEGVGWLAALGLFGLLNLAAGLWLTLIR